MRTILATFLAILFLLPVSASGEIQTITQTVKQAFGGSQSADDARIAAVAKAKREALERAGTYIESTTVVKNAQVEKDEILALSAGVLKAEVISQKNYHTDDAFGIEVTVRVEVDTAILEARLKKVLEDRTHFEQLKQARAREKELLEKIAMLEGENRKPGKSDENATKLVKEFQDASRGLTAVDWFGKALSLWSDNRFTDPEKAIEYLNHAIQLKPDLAEAYSMLGLVYDKLGQFKRAIQNCNEAIRLNPDFSMAYRIRGGAYYRLGQYQRAIEDYNKVIRLNPDDAKAYLLRGVAYFFLGQYQNAIQDYNEAIRLKPDLAEAYGLRGGTYFSLGRYQRAIEDYNKAIQLNPNDAEAYLLRGGAYSNLGQYQSAIQDYNEAIRLKPNDAKAYNDRGGAYYRLSQYQRAIEDYNEAIRMKPKGALAFYNRGIAYDKLSQHHRAIEDYNEAIRLKPDDAAAYNNRGIAYILSGNNAEGCRSFIQACELGVCKGYEVASQKGDCR